VADAADAAIGVTAPASATIAQTVINRRRGRSEYRMIHYPRSAA
jgi:hypothetical protein